MKRVPRDEESQARKGVDASLPENATGVASSSFGGSSGGAASHNPILLTKLVLRKVLTMITSDDGSDISRGLPLIKDIFRGMILGFVVISSIIFLDREFARISNGNIVFVTPLLILEKMDHSLPPSSLSFVRHQYNSLSIGTQLS